MIRVGKIDLIIKAGMDVRSGGCSGFGVPYITTIHAAAEGRVIVVTAGDGDIIKNFGSLTIRVA